MSRPAKPTGGRVGRELAKHRVIHPAAAERVGNAVVHAWESGDLAYSTVLDLVPRHGGRADQRAIALSVRRFGIALT